MAEGRNQGGDARYKTLKKILHAGHGLPPEFVKDTKAIFDYEVLQPLDEECRNNIDAFPPGRDRFTTIDTTKKPWPDGYGKPLELVFGKKFQLPIFESSISTMLVDEVSLGLAVIAASRKPTFEVSQFDIAKSELLPYPILSGKLRDISRAEVDKSYSTDHHHQHHCAAGGPIHTGYPILDELIEKPSCLRIIFHLLRVLKPDGYQQDSWQLSSAQKLERLEIVRQAGNTLFSQQKHLEASEKYREALTILDSLLLLEKPGDPEWGELDRKNIPLYSNLCQCFLNLQRFYEAQETATEVLKRDGSNEKALFRRAKARIGTWDLDLAEKDLNRLLEINPTKMEVLVSENLKLVAEKRKEKDACDRVAYKAMFARDK